eukprot:scaffold7349_cov173-Amphora_coffeaeformis.AAC.97
MMMCGDRKSLRHRVPNQRIPTSIISERADSSFLSLQKSTSTIHPCIDFSVLICRRHLRRLRTLNDSVSFLRVTVNNFMDGHPSSLTSLLPPRSNNNYYLFLLVCDDEEEDDNDMCRGDRQPVHNSLVRLDQ